MWCRVPSNLLRSSTWNGLWHIHPPCKQRSCGSIRGQFQGLSPREVCLLLRGSSFTFATPFDPAYRKIRRGRPPTRRHCYCCRSRRCSHCRSYCCCCNWRSGATTRRPEGPRTPSLELSDTHPIRGYSFFWAKLLI